jgi:3-methyladenine DNA glycosylase AlkC
MNSNSNELYDWVTTINLVAAMFSSPPLPSGVGSSKTFQRPLLPVAKTRYTLHEQFEYHKKHVKQLQSELTRLEAAAGASLQTNLNTSSATYFVKDDKSFDKDKYNFLHYEVRLTI